MTRRLNSLNLSQLDPALPDVDVDVELKGFATVPALAWASTFELLGGARYIAAISPNFAVADYTLVAEAGGPGFWPWEQRFYVSAKYGFDYGIQQRFKSNNLMLNFIWITNWLNGT